MTMPSEVQFLKAHVSINVRDVESSIGFYRKMLGIEPSKVRTGYAKFDVQNPPLNLALNEVPNLADAGALSHLGLQVSSTDDVLAIRTRWSEAGLITRDEMKTDCCYATQDKTWVHDPDGNEWEAFVVLKDNLPEAVSAGACCGGPAPKEVDACCVKDANAKAAGASGCGCSTAATA
jgi:catechol 2,3-dioxygenase-like lactoylglutathione lyase family enzyme